MAAKGHFACLSNSQTAQSIWKKLYSPDRFSKKICNQTLKRLGCLLLDNYTALQFLYHLSLALVAFVQIW